MAKKPNAMVRGKREVQRMATLNIVTVTSRTAVLLLLAMGLHGQQQQPGQQPVSPVSPQQSLAQPQQPNLERIRQSYVLGPGDQVQVRAIDVEEIGAGPYGIDADGIINLPLLGRINAGGLTVEALERDMVQRLKQYLRDPKVIVTVMQFRTEPVFFIGAFRSPGIYTLQGRRRLIDMTTSIGGLQPNASRRIRITRRTEYGPIPVANAVLDKDAKVSTAEIGLGTLRDNINLAEDIELMPYDIVSAERAEMVYVNGEVARVGSLELGERTSMSVTQVIALSGGLSREAAPEKARVLRPVLDTSRRAEIPLNLKQIMNGYANDFPLLPNDVLYVPRSSSRTFWRTVGVAIPVATALGFLFR